MLNATGIDLYRSVHRKRLCGGMKLDSLERRLKDLEQMRNEPLEVKFHWSEDEIPIEHRDSVIKLRWFDDAGF